MNKKQRYVILIGCILIAGMTLFPPYRGVLLQSGSKTYYKVAVVQGDTLSRFIGYHFICKPPSPKIVHDKLFGESSTDNERFRKSVYTSHLDIERLAAQIVAVVLITCGLAVVFSAKKNRLKE